jgi:hypothetical protein
MKSDIVDTLALAAGSFVCPLPYCAIASMGLQLVACNRVTYAIAPKRMYSSYRPHR